MFKLPSLAVVRSAVAWYFLGAGLLALVVASYATAMIWVPSPISTLLGMLMLAISMAFLWRWVVITVE